MHTPRLSFLAMFHKCRHSSSPRSMPEHQVVRKSYLHSACSLHYCVKLQHQEYTERRTTQNNNNIAIEHTSGGLAHARPNYVLETLCLTFLHCCTFTPNTQPSLRTSSPPVPHMMKSSGLAGLLSLSWRLTAEWSCRPSGQGWPGPPLASTLVHSCMHGRTHATMIMKTQLYTM